MSDIAVTVTNAGAAAVTVSGGSTVNATVGNGGAVNVATGTISPGDATVVSGTLAIGTVTTLPAGSAATATNVGTAYHAIINLGIPEGNVGSAGPPNVLSIGTVTASEPGSAASATISGTSPSQTLSLVLPRGDVGPANILSIGTVTSGETASATISGSAPSQTLSLVLPVGPAGPQGAAGPEGPAANLSSATPAALGTASAGVSTSASRADHVHAMPSYGDVGAAAASHSHDYVTAINKLTGSLTLAAGSNITITPDGSTLTIAATGGIADGDAVDGGDYVGVQDLGIQISVQPQDAQAGAGVAFSVSVTASYITPISYQWQRRIIEQGGTTYNGAWVDLADRTTATTTITEPATGIYQYRVVMTASGTPQKVSNAATVYVGAIQITQQPTAPATVPLGDVVTLSVTAEWPGPISYQWQWRQLTGWGGTPVYDPVPAWQIATNSGPTGFGATLPSWQTSEADAAVFQYRCLLTAAGAVDTPTNVVEVTYYVV